MSQTVIVDSTRMPELKKQNQSEKLPDVPSAVHVWPRDPRIGLHMRSFVGQFVDPCVGD